MRKIIYVLLALALVLQLSLLYSIASGYELWKPKPKIVSIDFINPKFYQGLATDGKRWIFSHRYSLYVTKIDDYKSLLRENEDAIPSELKREGYDHLGDIEIYEGKIYAPLVDKLYTKPLIALYSADTLEYLGSIGPLPQRHMPWCTIDPSSETILSSEFNNVNEIYVYDMNGNLIDKIELSETINRVQGGKLLGRHLYLTADDGGDTIYKVDTETGEVEVFLKIPTPFEMKGIGYLDGRLYVIIAISGFKANLLFTIDFSRQSINAATAAYLLILSIIFTLAVIYIIAKKI
ncbi:MAG: hypothetical protein DRJ38_10345 [Thermoprotei archaeon]|nr:MAG: hypothetical protein DRJ38_10345 [Thermoprotei archaeon]